MKKKELQIQALRCKSCGLCVHSCPRHCLEISDKRNRSGYNVVELVHPEDCVGCGLCVRTCPEPQCLELKEIEPMDFPDAEQ